MESWAMLRNSWLFGLLALSMLVWSPYDAAADWWKDESGKDKREYAYKEEYKRNKHGYKYKWQDGNCKYEYKQDKHGYKEKRKCKGGASYAWNPPPWAPAYGNGGGQRGRQPIDLGTGRCNRELLGSLLGAAAGGLAGSQIGDGRGQLAAVAGGTLLGFLMGGTIGRNMDEVDQNCVGQALEHAGDGQQIAWNNPQTGAQYQVVPTRTVQGSDGRYCREYTATSVVSGRNQQTYGRACRQPDGSWKLVD
jgi:surface antigen